MYGADSEDVAGPAQYLTLGEREDKITGRNANCVSIGLASFSEIKTRGKVKRTEKNPTGGAVHRPSQFGENQKSLVN